MDYKYIREINYYETDKMGIVHHSNYIRFLEEARCRWMKELGLPMEKLEDLGYTIPTLEVNCKYLYPVTSGDVISIKPYISEYNGVRMTISYEVINTKINNEVIKAITKHCFTNKELKPVNMKKSNSDIHRILEKVYGD
jgi:acyl-CoA thioester hydrolase